MPVKHKIFYTLAVIHLVMIALFASHYAEWGKMNHPLSKVMSTAGSYTGSNNIFSFFAPALSDQPYVVYAIKDTANKKHVIDFTGKSLDFTNRVNNIYGSLTIPEARPIISASLGRFARRTSAGIESYQNQSGMDRRPCFGQTAIQFR